MNRRHSRNMYYAYRMKSAGGMMHFFDQHSPLCLPLLMTQTELGSGCSTLLRSV